MTQNWTTVSSYSYFLSEIVIEEATTATVNKGSKSSENRRRRFTEEQVELLFQGVVRFGAGNWQAIWR